MANEENSSAEMCVLASMLTDREAIHKVIGSLEADDFLDERNRVVFESIMSVYEKGNEVSMYSINEDLKNKKKLTFIGGLTYLTSLADTVIYSSDIQTYINIVRDNSLVNRFFTTIKDIEKEYNTKEIDDISEFIGASEKKIVEVTKQRRVSDFLDMKTVLSTIVSTLDDRTKTREENKGKRPSYLIGTTTGYDVLDRLIGGFQKTDFIILAARPSVGKTALALNFASRAAHSGAPVGFFSLEMSASQVALRLLSERSGMSTYDIEQLPLQKADEFFSTKTGISDHETDIVNLNQAMYQLSKEPFYIDELGGQTLADIQAKCRKLKNNFPDLGLIVIDYLGLIRLSTRNSRNDRQQEIAEIARGLKALAKEIEVPILTLCQLSRGVESRQSHRPVLSDLRDSGAIEQDADQVFFIYREDYYAKTKDKNSAGDNSTFIPPEVPIEDDATSESKNTNSEVELILAKNRRGRLGTIKFMFLKKFCRFELAAEEIYD